MRQISNILAYFEEPPGAADIERGINVAREAGAKLTLVSVVKPARTQVLFARADFDLDKIEQLLVRERRDQFEDAIRKVPSGDVEISARVYVGDPVDTVIEAVQKDSFDLLIKLHPAAEEVGQPVFGSLDMRLMRSCPCTVVMARSGSETYSDRAVAALDIDEGDETMAELNREILDSMSLLAHKDFMGMKEIHIVHAWSVYGEQLFKRGKAKMPENRFRNILNEEESRREQWLQDLVDRYRDSLGKTAAGHFNPKLILLHGDPNTVIPQYTDEINADTLSMGTVSRSGIRRFLMGNTAESVLNRVHCSVVAHKPPGFSIP